MKLDGTCNYTSIQQAYDNASDFDTILVYPGRYAENVYLHRNINCTLSSLYLFSGDRSDIVNTIIDGDQRGSCIFITDNPYLHIINGFTITNAAQAPPPSNIGGGVYIKGSGLTISSCIIEYNTADIGGGGINFYSGSLFLSGTTIRYNRSYSSVGGISPGWETDIVFDSVNRCNIYLNSGFVADIASSSYSSYLNVYVDTFTVFNPDAHFLTAMDTKGFPIDNISIDIRHAKLQPVHSDLYVNPNIGNDTNSGLSWEEPLQTLGFALKQIASDSLDPHNVFLANGVYGPQTNGDHFSLGCRSYVNIIGETQDSVILDADSLSGFFHGHSLMEHFRLKNMSLVRGDFNLGLLYLRPCENVNIEHVTIRDNAGVENAGFVAAYCDSLVVRDLTIYNIVGGGGGIGSTIDDKARSFRVENLIVDNILPEFPVPEEGGGGGFSFAGHTSTPGMYRGIVKNMQITNVLAYRDPVWGPGLPSGIGLGNKIEIDITNATIGDNISRRGPQGSAIMLNDGADASFYNSILHGDSLIEICMHTAGTPTPATLNMSYSNVEGGEEEVLFVGPGHTLNWLEGNIDADPIWVGTAEAQYELVEGSPCIDAGVPMYEVGVNLPYIKHENGKYVLYMFDGDTLHLPATDLAGNTRIINNRIDMGSYEYDPNTSIDESLDPKTQNSKLLEAWPNPFRYSVNISYVQEEYGSASIRVFDIEGRCVNILKDTKGSPSEGTIVWNGKDSNGNQLKAGTYIINYEFNDQVVDELKLIKR